MEGTVFRARGMDYFGRIGICPMSITKDGRTGVLASAEFTLLNENETVPEASVFEITPKAAQQLMDDLWACGVRPAESRYTSETFSAQKAHISDLRKVAFKSLGVDE